MNFKPRLLNLSLKCDSYLQPEFCSTSSKSSTFDAQLIFPLSRPSLGARQAKSLNLGVAWQLCFKKSLNKHDSALLSYFATFGYCCCVANRAN